MPQTLGVTNHFESCVLRGRLFELKPRPVIVAHGREDWVGWVETEQLADAAITNTARVIAEVNPRYPGV